MIRKITAMLLAVCLMLTLSVTAFADGLASDKAGCLILGADLKKDQIATVYKLMGVEDDSIYAISNTTNAEEHAALDDYLPQSVIGSKALSSILLIPGKKGSGIHVEAYNISYCTVSMYQNALIDAGIEDCTIHIAAPFAVSGTCALVSAMKGYALMSGEEIPEINADAAVDELVTTGELGDEIGDNDKAAEVIAALKQKALSEKLDEAGMGAVLDQICQNMNVSINEGTRQNIINLMLKIQNTNIDVDALEKQAGELYNKVKGTVASLNIDKEAAVGFLQKLIEAFKAFFSVFANK